ncbi:MAG: BatD family protein [Motiliproteus sp.]
MAKTPLGLITQTVMLLLLALPARAAVQLTLSSDQGQVGQPFELRLEVTQTRSVIGTPELGPLQQDFNILSNRSVYLTKKRGGHTLFISRWTLSLSPKRAGTLQIPALQVKGEQSQAHNFQAQENPKPKAKPLILKVTIDSTEAYQGSPLSLSVKLYYSLNLQRAELTQPQIKGVRIEQFGDQLSYTESIDQQRYQVIEQKYLLQALKPGHYRIPTLHFNGSDTSAKQLSSRSTPVEFDILPLPHDPNRQIQLVASEVRLEQHWQQPLDNLRAGDTLTRTVILTAHDLPANWLPDISFPAPEGISAYPQPPQLHQSINNGVLVSRKQIDVKLLLTQPGEHLLPGITVVWWDSLRNKQEIAQLAPSEVRVLPFIAEITDPIFANEAALATAAPTTVIPTIAAPTMATSRTTPLSSSTPDTPWQGWVWAAIALICAVGWSLSQQRNSRLTTELKALKQTPKPTAPITPAITDPARQHNSFSALTEACEQNDPELAYRYLFEWAALHWPGMRIRTLEDIEELAQDPTLTYLLKNLQHQLQDPSDSWHGDLLIERIRRLRQKNRQQNRHTPSSSGSIRVTVRD